MRRTVSTTMRDLPRGKRVQGAGTDAIRTLADRAKVYSQTQKAAGAGRQASVRTQNQNSMSYQTTQRRSAVQQGKIRKRRGK